MLLLMLLGLAGAQIPLEVETTAGRVLGYKEDGVMIWRGIPFAQPPTGNLRLRPPVAPKPWQGVREAHTLRSQCPQFSVGPFHLGHEDCLYLDVYVPEGASLSDPLPVMMWIFGGGYVVGDKNEFELYNGKHLASKHNVIIVAINYRLSVLGFLALESLAAETSTGTTGNFALQDQTLGMQWVTQNIKNFGGDVKRRLLFGESAGAFSVCWHLVSPPSAALFDVAIMESGTCDSVEFFQKRNDATEWGQYYAEAVGCFNTSAQPECLRALSTEKILAGHVLAEEGVAGYEGYLPPLYPVMPWGPTIDGTKDGLLALPLDLITEGKFNEVPLLLGTNLNEGSIFIPMLPFLINGVHLPLSLGDAEKVLEHFFNSSVVDQLFYLYPPSDFATVDELAAVVLRDYFFVCSGDRVLKQFHAHRVPTFMYHFVFDGKWIDYKHLGDFHASELKFVWDNDVLEDHIFNEKDKEMAAVFGSYWTNFAKSVSSPGNGTTNLPWPLYTPGNEETMILDNPPRIEKAVFEKKCSFWNQVHAG